MYFMYQDNKVRSASYVTENELLDFECFRLDINLHAVAVMMSALAIQLIVC